MADVVGANKVQIHDEDTQNSGSGSGFSDLSALENETDDFGRRLLQHQRDAQRFNNAVHGNQQAFRKARPFPRVAERLEREEREQDFRGGQSHERTGSDGSTQSDPPVTVPREWGRKARKQTNWMRKILEPSENGSEHVGETLKPEQHAIYPHRTLFTGDVNWEGTSPLQSIENTPPSMRRQRTLPTPSSMRHMNTTLKHNSESDDGDFSGVSLLASTPATRLPRKIDELTRREIENVERQAVTTRNLDQIDELLPNGTLRRTSSSRLRERAIADGMTSPTQLLRPVTAPGKPVSPSRIPRRPRNLVANKENFPLNGHVNSSGNSPTKGSDTAGLLDRTAQPVNIKNGQRPRHQREDSMNLLKKLARVSSMSPSPAREKPDDAATDGIEKIEKMRPLELAKAKSPDDIRRDHAKPATDTHQSHGEQPEASRAEHDEEHTDVRAVQSNGEADQKPVQMHHPSDIKKSNAGEGHIDNVGQSQAQPREATHAMHSQTKSTTTLEATARIQEETLSDAPLQIKSEPAHPKSALEAIIREVEVEQDGQQFGESTIQSLEDIIHPNLDLTETTLQLDLGTHAHEEDLDDGRQLTQEEKDRRQEDLAMDAMNKHLRAARTSIKDANKGLRRVENRIETAQEDQTHALTNKTVTIVQGKPDSHDNIHCACCGRHQSVWYALWYELRSCFYTWDPTSKYRIRFTWLGLACLFWWIWFLSESALCEIYCHPFAAYSMEGYGVDPDAPRFPFVIPTLIFRPIFRPFKFIWGPICEGVVDFMQALWYDLIGEYETNLPPSTPGRAPRPCKNLFTQTIGSKSQWVATATTTSVRVAQSVVDAVDEIGSMWDDEFLKQSGWEAQSLKIKRNMNKNL